MYVDILKPAIIGIIMIGSLADIPVTVLLNKPKDELLEACSIYQQLLDFESVRPDRFQCTFGGSYPILTNRACG
jgi:hypothetical protein